MTGHEQAAVREYLWGGVSGVSCLTAILRDARCATARDVETGVLRDMSDPAVGSWLGAVGYLIAVDQLGRCFTRGRPEFSRALTSFTDLSKGEVEALYALRCAFAHNYSPINVPPLRQRDQATAKVPRRYLHKFLLFDNEVEPLVTLPATPWTGTFAPGFVEQETRVNLRRVGDLVEEIVREVRRRFERADLALAIPLDEFTVRYRFFVVPDDRHPRL